MNQLSLKQAKLSISHNTFTCTFLPKNWQDDSLKYLEEYKHNCRNSLNRLLNL